MTATADYELKFDGSNYATFFVMKGNSSGDAVADDRAVALVETALTEKGWLEVAAGEGQAAVIVHTATPTTHTYQAFYNGWGGWHWRSPRPGEAPGFVEHYKVGTLVVSIFDAQTRRSIWRGFATDALSESPRHNATAAAAAVARMFRRFPPPAEGTAGWPRQAERSLGIAQIEHTATPGAVALDREPPTIIFSPAPALLIRIDGDPIYRPVPGTELQRVVNTKPLIVRDVAGMCYVKILDGWMEAYSLEAGSWAVSGVAPDGGDIAVRQAVASNTVDLLDGADRRTTGSQGLETGPAPFIFISTTPAALVVTDGPMTFAAVEGTSLEYAVNTTADVFREPTDQEIYVLISGRWYRAWRTSGPWQLVASRDLPADFARIPDGSPKASVKTTIAGTK
jgi:hypothetical protein